MGTLPEATAKPLLLSRGGLSIDDMSGGFIGQPQEKRVNS